MGIFNKSKHKEEKKKPETQKRQQPLGPSNNHDAADRGSHRPTPEEYAARKQQQLQQDQVKNRPMNSAYMNDKRNTPLPPLAARPTQRAEFPINEPVHDDLEEISQKDMELIISENKMLENTIREIRKKLYMLREETNHIPRLQQSLSDVRQQLRTALTTILQTHFEEQKFNRLVQLIEEDAHQLCTDVWDMYLLFEKTKKDEWKALLWKRTLKSFDQLDNRPKCQKWINDCFNVKLDHVDQGYCIICKKIGRIILQIKYESILESEAVTRNDQSTRNKVPSNTANENEKSREGIFNQSQHPETNRTIESDTRSLGIKEKKDIGNGQGDMQALNKKSSNIGSENKKSNRLSMYEIEEAQQKREKGIPKRTSSLAVYMNESILAQFQEDEKQPNDPALLDKHKK